MVRKRTILPPEVVFGELRDHVIGLLDFFIITGNLDIEPCGTCSHAELVDPNFGQCLGDDGACWCERHEVNLRMPERKARAKPRP